VCSEWPPPKRSKPLAVAIASSILSSEPNLLLKTIRAGHVARTLNLYRVDEIVIYNDRDAGPGDSNLLKLLLEYLATPPYLRKAKYPLLPELRYAGLLPPLRGPFHDAPQRPRPNALVAGLVEDCNGDECTLYLGRLGRVRTRVNAAPGDVVPLKITRVRPLRVEPAPPSLYTWYRVSEARDLARVLREYRRRGYLLVGASREGECPREWMPRLPGLARDKRGLLVAVGGPWGTVERDSQGEPFDVLVNTVPRQGSRTVRSEEALNATLALLNALLEGH